MIIFSAFTPHAPLILPSLRTEESEKKLGETIKAFKELADALYVKKPETILLISSHGAGHKDVFVFNLHDPYRISLAEFGDHGEYPEYHPDLMAIDRLQRQLRLAEMPISLSTGDSLDYGAAVPLIMLSEVFSKARIIPLSYSGLSPKEHFKFGQALGRELKKIDRRIAVVASGDMSHCLTSKSPGGFTKYGPEFDAKLQEIITQSNAAGLLKMDPEMIRRAQECAYLPITILMGILDNSLINPKILAYEAPFGVGYLTVDFQIP